MFLGMMCLYVSQVRATLVVVCVSVIALMAVLGLRRANSKLAIVGVVSSAVLFLSFAWAVAVGGSVVTKRISSLTSSDPRQTYAKNRGIFLKETITHLLPRYPLGAGLGRFGMINLYFADPRKPSLWAEIEWTSWLLDGGVPLIVAYVVAVGFTIRTAWSIAFSRDRSDLWVWAAVVFAYDWGVLAFTFSYPVFEGQFGVEFWLLNTALFVASQANRRSQQPVARIGSLARYVYVSA
jgi:hypothetical protein